MNDTSAELRDLQQQLLQQRSGEERFLMGISMCQTARAIVRSSLPGDLSDSERRVQMFLRLYNDDFDASARQHIVDWFRSGKFNA